MVIKLKHLDILSSEEVDYTSLMKDISIYSKWRFWKIFEFIKLFSTVRQEVELVRQTEVKEVSENSNCKILRPESINSIPFMAMIDLQALFDRGGEEKTIGNLIIETISIACFSSNNKQDYDSESIEFSNFRQQVANENIFDMLGLYNWLDQSIVESQLMWEEQFSEVEVTDKDYDNAGGRRMNKFNVLVTIKSICQDFNVPYKDALQMSYGITQANSLAKATQSHIQHLMSIAIEERMRNKRAKK